MEILFLILSVLKNVENDTSSMSAKHSKDCWNALASSMFTMLRVIISTASDFENTSPADG